MYMGSCFSSIASKSANQRTAKVVALNGTLREYSISVKVSQVLGPQHPSCFLCNSDSLYYHTKIPALGSNELLQLGQLYFILPVGKLESPLMAQDMVALAVKASSALATASGKLGRRRSFQIVPVAEVDGVGDVNEELDGFIRINERSLRVSGSKQDHMKEGRSASLRVRAAHWSSRARLNTIEEVAE